MATPTLPSVELIQGSPAPVPTGAPRWRRWKVFLTVFLLGLAIGLAIVYGRSPVYRAAASVLTVKPKAVDRQSAAADIEHVAIQGRLLLGEELLGSLSRSFTADGELDGVGVDELRDMLNVVPVPETNLLELRAEGADPKQLERVVNRWAESYEDFRLQEIAAATGRTTAELSDEQAELARKIETARAELLAFRERHDIVSLERGENRSLAGLQGLNNSLNKAREKEIEIRAQKLAIDEAIAKGEPVIPREQKAEIIKMKLEVERARARLAELNEKYTQRYIETDPDLVRLPEMLHAMERDLLHALELASATARSEAQQALEAASLTVATLERQLDEHQRNVQGFTERFKEFKSYEEGLTRLERLYAETQERIAQIQIRNQQKFPPIQIVEWARVPTQPIYPHYRRDLMIALAVVLTLALFVTWLLEYLSAHGGAAASAPYLGVRIYSNDRVQVVNANDTGKLITTAAGAPASLAHNGTVADLSPPNHAPLLPRDLASAEIKALLAVVDPVISGYCALLLSGVSPSELEALHRDCFDPAGGRIKVPGASERDLAIEAPVWSRLEHALTAMDSLSSALSVPELELRLVRAARDAGLADPASIDAVVLWHSYVLYLVRQGIDTDALAERVGTIAPPMLDALLHYAPPGDKRPLDSIDFVHPALAI